MYKLNRNLIIRLIPLMLTFFAMGFVDLVGIATNYIKKDFQLTDFTANLLPSMVFFWFFIGSVPTSMLMNKIGRRKTVLISLIICSIAMVLPLLDYSFALMLISFSLLGIGNTIMQVSLNPLISNIIHGDRLSSVLTFGQFIKSFSAFLAPIIAAWSVAWCGDWRLLFPIYLIEGVIAFITLAKEKIPEKITGKISSFKQCFSLLKSPLILFCFLGIVCHVGIDVGTNLSAPKILMDKTGISLASAGYATSIYFLFRLFGCLSGSIILARYSISRFFRFSTALLCSALIGLFLFKSIWTLYICIACIGYANSNLFSILFTQALLSKPNRKNDISGLMIMGIVGGTIFPALMGFFSDLFNTQTSSVAIMGIAALFLLFLSKKVTI